MRRERKKNLTASELKAAGANPNLVTRKVRRRHEEESSSRAHKKSAPKATKGGE